MKLENSLVHMEFLTFSVLKKVGYINSNAYDEDYKIRCAKENDCRTGDY